jgi:hypothetical protein
MNVRSFVEGTQRGYAYGLKKKTEMGEKTLIERYVRCSSIKDADIDKAYAEASLGAHLLLETYKRRPDLIRRQGGRR